eukprot:m.348281 g.348281  ORF g.348281 m.348281 type:complete len:274 (+) comp19876_c3_seq2:419-1240(+)
MVDDMRGQWPNIPSQVPDFVETDPISGYGNAYDNDATADAGKHHQVIKTTAPPEQIRDALVDGFEAYIKRLMPTGTHDVSGPAGQVGRMVRVTTVNICGGGEHRVRQITKYHTYKLVDIGHNHIRIASGQNQSSFSATDGTLAVVTICWRQGTLHQIDQFEHPSKALRKLFCALAAFQCFIFSACMCCLYHSTKNQTMKALEASMRMLKDFVEEFHTTSQQPPPFSEQPPAYNAVVGGASAPPAPRAASFFCTACGVPQAQDSLFCNQCGHKH